jgi:hypothetical protein
MQNVQQRLDIDGRFIPIRTWVFHLPLQQDAVSNAYSDERGVTANKRRRIVCKRTRQVFSSSAIGANRSYIRGSGLEADISELI